MDTLKKVSKKVVEDLPPHVLTDSDEVIVAKVPLGKTKGVIHSCNALRLREGANTRSRELARMPVESRVDIDLDNSTDSFYEVTYLSESGYLVGFCLKEFVRAG